LIYLIFLSEITLYKGATMFKMSMSTVLLVIAFSMRFGVEAAAAQTDQQKTNVNAQNSNEKYELMNTDQKEGTDIFGIPFDESAIEDEAQIDRDEKKDVFPLPHSR